MNAIEKGWRPIGMPKDVKELEKLLEWEKMFGFRGNVVAIEKYLTKLKEEEKCQQDL